MLLKNLLSQLCAVVARRLRLSSPSTHAFLVEECSVENVETNVKTTNEYPFMQCPATYAGMQCERQYEKDNPFNFMACRMFDHIMIDKRNPRWWKWVEVSDQLVEYPDAW